MLPRGGNLPFTKHNFKLEEIAGSNEQMPNRRFPRPGKKPVLQMEKVLTKTRLCVYNIHGCCDRGDACKFAHSKEELRVQPSFQKTKLCQSLKNGQKCRNVVCSFAHNLDEMQVVNNCESVDGMPDLKAGLDDGLPEHPPPSRNITDASTADSWNGADAQGSCDDPDQDPEKESLLLKTRLCMYYQNNLCERGDQCRFAHGTEEIRISPSLEKTKICPSLKQGKKCPRAGCLYAHSHRELRVISSYPGADVDSAFFGYEVDDLSGAGPQNGPINGQHSTPAQYSHVPLNMTSEQLVYQHQSGQIRFKADYEELHLKAVNQARPTGYIGISGYAPQAFRSRQYHDPHAFPINEQIYERFDDNDQVALQHIEAHNETLRKAEMSAMIYSTPAPEKRRSRRYRDEIASVSTADTLASDKSKSLFDVRFKLQAEELSTAMKGLVAADEPEPFPDSHAFIELVSKQINEAWATKRGIHVTISVWDADQGGILVDCCNEFPNLVGRSRSEIMSTTCDFLHDVTVVGLADHMTDIWKVATGELEDCICVLPCKRNGVEEFPNLMHYMNVTFAAGTQAKRLMFCVQADVSRVFLSLTDLPQLEKAAHAYIRLPLTGGNCQMAL